MRRSRIVRAVVTVVLVAAAVVGYVLWIPMQRPSSTLLGRLVIRQPVKGFKNDASVDEPSVAKSPVAMVKTAAKKTRGETGVDAVAWKGVKAESSASLVVLALPTLAFARTAQKQAQRQYVSEGALTADDLGYGGTVTDTSVPGAKGAYFLPGTTETLKPTGKRADLLVFRVHRVVALVSVDGTGAPSAVAASSLATAEYHHLLQVGSTPELAETVFPLVATIVYVVVALAALALLEAAPSVLAILRRRRHLAAEERIRRQRASRGAKVVTRRARPAGAGRARTRR